MDFIWNSITDWLKEVLVSGIVSNLSGMFDSTNAQIGEIAGQVGLTPQAWNSGILQIPLHGIEFCHTVAYGRTCRKDHPAASGEFIHVAALAEHIAGFLRIRCGKTGDIAHLCI